MSKIRILVLTSSTGGGHDARAEAFADWCFQLYRHDVDVRIEQMLENSSVINRAGVNFYNKIQASAPWVHKAFYAIVECQSLLNQDTVSLGRGYYVQVIEEYQPHLVFSVHDCLNRGYFQLARKILGNDKVKCATYCGEFSGGWGYSRNWIEPTVDMYFYRTATAHFEVVAPQERGTFREERLGLRPDLFTVFLATGGNGANNHFDLLPALVKRADRCQAIVICGRNKQAYNDLVHWRANHPEFNCYVEGYSEIVHLLMQVSDVIVTRGGTTTCAKALHFKCPIIFNASGGIMPQEELTWKYLRNGAASDKIENGEDFDRIIGSWLSEPETYIRMRDNFLRLRYEEDPTILIDELVNLAASVSAEKPVRLPFRGHSHAPFTGVL
jgi:processive 1,2-diacylglycerol beta-glucosyltransferase